MVKPQISYPSGSWQILLVVIAMLCVLIGLLIDVTSFLISLSAGIVIAILAFLLIDRFVVKYLRAKQWAKVRKLTLGAIAAHICDIASDIYGYFPIRDHRSMGVILEGRIPNLATLTGFEDLLEQMHSLPNSVSKDKSISDVAIDFYEAVTWDLDQIQGVLTPRVIQSSTDQTLIDALMEFDDARRNLHNSIIQHKLSYTHMVFPCLLLLVQSSCRLYKALYKSWED